LRGGDQNSANAYPIITPECRNYSSRQGCGLTALTGANLGCTARNGWCTSRP